jgi:hypothetical protein
MQRNVGATYSLQQKINAINNQRIIKINGFFTLYSMYVVIIVEKVRGKDILGSCLRLIHK